MGPLTLDASVVIALLDSADAHHLRAVDEVGAADERGFELVVPASAYSEALVAFAREGRVRDARDAIASMGISVIPLDGSTAERAAELRAAHERLRLPDAMVLATAHELRGPLLSYDQRLQRYAAESGYSEREFEVDQHVAAGRVEVHDDGDALLAHIADPTGES